MPAETIIVHKGHGLPYSKGLMAQAISATGLSPGRAFELARVIEERLDGGSIRTADLHALAEEVLRTEQDDLTARRYASWRRLDRLERPQAEALTAAFGLSEAEGATRFTIGAATLALLAAASEEQPLLLLVDDAHWLDRASADALAFAVRRLHVDSVAALFAMRPGEGRPFSGSGLTNELVPLMTVGGRAV